jgi:hypothetical protein
MGEDSELSVTTELPKQGASHGTAPATAQLQPRLDRLLNHPSAATRLDDQHYRIGHKNRFRNRRGGR